MPYWCHIMQLRHNRGLAKAAAGVRFLSSHRVLLEGSPD